MSHVGARVGDVFSVRIDEERFGLGQVVAVYGNNAYFFALFEPTFAQGQRLDLEREVRAPVALLALSLDAKIAVGDWRVLGNAPVPDDMPLPAFKEMVGTPDRVDVVDYSGGRRRPARDDEAERLPNRKIVAPVRLEKALRAKHGLEPWIDAYAELEPSTITSTARLFD
jgi:hypothetical protein